jgi:hypothetical protein
MAESPGVGVMLGAAGPCPEFTHAGKRWTVGHPTQAAKARLENLAGKVALDEVRRMKDVLDPAAYQETFAEVTRSLKDYRTWKPGWQRVVFDPEYAHLFFMSLLQEKHPGVTEGEVLELCAGAPEEVQAALAQVLPDFFQMLLDGIADRLTPEARAEVAGAVAKVRAALAPRVPPTAATNSA